MQVLELARCESIDRRENVIALGPSGAGGSHIALALGLAACHKGLSVGFTTAAAMVSEMMEARDERRGTSPGHSPSTRSVDVHFEQRRRAVRTMLKSLLRAESDYAPLKPERPLR
nr:ATP-binding protein [Marinicella sp. W31]MDC2878278.1 ATP-binding protein [Marinicella sp. W31]